MTEALITIPFFISTFVLTIFLGKLYRDKLQTMRESKQASLTTASANCGGVGIPGVQIAKVGVADIAMGMVQNLIMGAPWTDIFTRGFNAAIQVKDGTVSASATLHGGPFTVSISTKTKFMCNEKPEKVDFLKVFLWAYAKLTPF